MRTEPLEHPSTIVPNPGQRRGGDVHPGVRDGVVTRGPLRGPARVTLRVAVTALLLLASGTCGVPCAGSAWPDGYASVVDAIARRGFDGAAGLPQGFDLAVPAPDAVGRVRVQYNFAWNDPAFSGLISPRLVGDPSYSLYLVRDAADLPTVVTLPRSSPQYPLAALPWVAVDGEKLDYLRARPGQWDINLTPYDDSPLNPWRRAAAASGLAYDTAQRTTGGFYANNYWVTFDIDVALLLRPDADQLPAVATAASAPMVRDDAGIFMVDPAWYRPWAASAPTPVIDAGDGTPLGSQSALLRYWWGSQVPTGRFPFTGIGYSYDWYYQDPGRWAAGDGVGPAEFICMPSTADADVTVTIVSVQTTAQWLGATTQFPNVPLTVPEVDPGGLPVAVSLLVGMLAIAERVRRRGRDESAGRAPA